MQQAERSNLLAMRSLAWLALSLGRRTAQWALVPACFYFLLFAPRARAASRDYLRRVFDREPSWRELFQHYLCFAKVALDRVFLLKQKLDLFEVDVHGEEIVLDMLARKQGAFLIGAHLGSFEILRVFGEKRGNMRVRMVMFEGNAQKVRQVLEALDPQRSTQVIEAGQLDSMLQLQEALENGEFVGMLGDRTLSEASHISCPFFGDEAAFSSAPFRIAAILGYPVILMLGLYHGDNRYEVRLERLMDTAGIERGARGQAVRDAIGLYVQRLEHYCRKSPYNWFNFYDFWAPPDKK